MKGIENPDQITLRTDKLGVKVKLLDRIGDRKYMTSVFSAVKVNSRYHMIFFRPVLMYPYRGQDDTSVLQSANRSVNPIS